MTTKSLFVKLNPDLYIDQNNVLDKLQQVCCDSECHTIAMSYHKKSPHIIVVSLFHKGTYILNLKYDLKRKTIDYKFCYDFCFCFSRPRILNFIRSNREIITHFFKREVLPINSAINENASWYNKKKILQQHMCDDTIGIVKKYLCFERKCKCGKVLKEIYNQCWKCFEKSTV